MKVSFNSSEMLAALKTVGKAIDRRPLLPLLSYALCEQTSDGRLTVTGGSTEMAMTVLVGEGPCVTEGFVPVCIDVSMLSQLLSSIPSQTIEAETTSEDDIWQTTYTFDGGSITLPSFCGADYPKQASLGETVTTFSMNAVQLANILSDAIPCASTDDVLRVVMKSVAFDITAEGVTFAASDSHVLYRYRHTPGAPFLAEGNAHVAVVPRSAAQAMLELADGCEGDVTVTDDCTRMIVRTARGTLQTVLQEGNYPNYNNIFPEKQAHYIDVNKAELVSVLRRALIASDKKSVNIDHVDGGIVVNSSSDMVGTKYHEHLAADIDAEFDKPFVGRFAVDFLFKGLAAVHTERVHLTFDAHNRQFVVHSVPEVESQTVVMPIMVG